MFYKTAVIASDAYLIIFIVIFFFFFRVNSPESLLPQTQDSVNNYSSSSSVNCAYIQLLDWISFGAPASGYSRHFSPTRPLFINTHPPKSNPIQSNLSSPIAKTNRACMGFAHAIAAFVSLVTAMAVMAAGRSEAGATSSYVRTPGKSEDMPADADVFAVPPGYNAPQQVRAA